MHDICFSLSDVLNIIISRSMPVAANGIMSFCLWLSSIPSHVCTTFPYPFTCRWIFSSFSCAGHKAHCGAQEAFWIMDSPGYMLRSGIAAWGQMILIWRWDWATLIHFRPGRVQSWRIKVGCFPHPNKKWQHEHLYSLQGSKSVASETQEIFTGRTVFRSQIKYS